MSIDKELLGSFSGIPIFLKMWKAATQRIQ